VAIPTLRPLSVGEILDAGIKILTRHWRVLTLTVAGVVLPVQVIYVLLLASVAPEQLKGTNTTDSTSSDPGAAAVVAFLIGLLLIGLTFLVVFTACFKSVSDAWLGVQPSARRSLRFGLRRMPMVFLLYLVLWIALVLAFVALIVPFFWLSISWCLVIPVLLFERVGPFKAMRRSFQLVRGRWWATLLLVAVGYLLATVVGAVIQGILLEIARTASNNNLVADSVAQVIGSTVSATITYPYAAAVLTILYFDQRVRKEGFDLQLLAEGLGTAIDPDAPLPAPLVGPDYAPEERAGAPYWPPPPGWKPSPAAAPAPAASGWDAPAYPSAGARGWAPPDAGPGAETAPAADPPAWGSQPSAPEPPAWGSRPSVPDTRWGEPFGGQPPVPARPAQDAPSADGPAADSPDAPPAPPADARAAWEAAARSADAPPEPEPDAEEPEPEPKRDKRRADWLPPEPPRGPSGL
jgi:hypothetical protein